MKELINDPHSTSAESEQADSRNHLSPEVAEKETLQDLEAREAKLTGQLKKKTRRMSRFTKIILFVANAAAIANLYVVVARPSGEKKGEKKIEHATEQADEQINLDDQKTREKFEQVNFNTSERALIKKIEEQIGVGDIIVMEKLDSVHSEEERQKALSEEGVIDVRGFEKSKISNEAVMDAVRNLPSGFRRQKQSAHIIYVDVLREGNPLFGGGTVAAQANRVTREIEFSKGSQNDAYQWIFNTLLAHEEAHLNDPMTNKLLTLHERLALLDKILDRVKSPGRFKSQYVENLSNTDKKMELTLKWSEYWAEIVGAYLSDDYHLLPQEDRKLVEEVFSKIDPGFDRVKSLIARGKIIAAYNPDYKVNQFDSGAIKTAANDPSKTDGSSSNKTENPDGSSSKKTDPDNTGNGGDGYGTDYDDYGYDSGDSGPDKAKKTSFNNAANTSFNNAGNTSFNNTGNTNDAYEKDYGTGETGDSDSTDNANINKDRNTSFNNTREPSVNGGDNTSFNNTGNNSGESATDYGGYDSYDYGESYGPAEEPEEKKE